MSPALRHATWFSACLVAGGVLAWLAVRAQAVFAPVLLFPLGLGLALGMVLLAVRSYCIPLGRASVVAGALLAATTLVVGQHYLSYRAACTIAIERQSRVTQQAKGFAALTAAEMVKPPESFAAYMQSEAARDHAIAGLTLRGPTVWAWWALDALIIAAASVAVTWRGVKGYNHDVALV